MGQPPKADVVAACKEGDMPSKQEDTTVAVQDSTVVDPTVEPALEKDPAEENATTTEGNAAAGETADKVTKAPMDASAGETAVIAAVEEPEETDGAVSDKGCGTWFC